MRALTILLALLIGTLFAFTMSSKHPPVAAPTADSQASAMQWATTTDPHEDPQVSQAPKLQSPPHP